MLKNKPINTRVHQNKFDGLFFCYMKRTIPFIVLFFSFISGFSQEKVKFTKKNFIIPSIVPSEYSCLDNFLTQSTFYQLGNRLPVSETNLKKEFFNIKGYIKEADNGQLKIFVTIPVPEYQKSRIDTIFNKKTLKFSYVPYSSFKVIVKVEVKCQSQTIYKEEFNTNEIVTSDSFATLEDLKKGLNKIEVNNEYGDEIEKAIHIALEKIQVKLNEKLGYYPQVSKETFVFLTSVEHPEYKQMLEFEKEITAQLKKVTLASGIDEQAMLPHLAYLESLLVKYPQSDENTKIRFTITNNLSQLYFLLENREKALFYADLLIKNDMRKVWGRELVVRTNNSFFVDKKKRTHTPRFSELKKLGFEIQQDEINEKEETRLAFFEKIERDIADWEQEKNNRLAYLEKTKAKRNNVLDSLASQNNAKILEKVMLGFGGGQIIKGIEKVHTLSKLSFEDSNVPFYEEKWESAFTNYLLKKKNPDLFYKVVNQAEGWQHDDRIRGEKWKKIDTDDYWETFLNLDPLYLLTSFRLDLWENYELSDDVTIDERLCYHLTYTEKTLNSKNRSVPKTEYHLYIDKETFRVISSEKTAFEDGKKLSFERKIFQDYRELISLNSGAIPHRILYQIEDYYGETFYQEQIEKIEINSGFANRIFVKEVYSGGFK